VLLTFCGEDPFCEADISRNFILKFVLRNGISIKDNIASFSFRLSLSNTPVDFFPGLGVTIFANTPFLENSGILAFAVSCKYLFYTVRTMKSHTLHEIHVFDPSEALHARGLKFDRVIQFSPFVSPTPRRG
jgi:hypothetical protein